MRGSWRDLALGVRLAVTGGGEARWRSALTAAGVALGVMLLLIAASIPHIVHAHDARVASMGVEVDAGHARLLGDWDFIEYRGETISGLELQQTGSNPPLPPGIKRIPAAGQIIVSPALLDLLRSEHGAQLRRWLPERVVGTIADVGLAGPSDLRAYIGAADLRERGATAITGFGGPPSSSFRGPLVTLLVILMAVALLLPIGVFVATASRFGSEQRNVRLAAIRLIGADRLSTARIAAGEALCGAVAGVAAGAVAFLAVRPAISHVDIAGISVFSADVQPAAWLTVLIVALVPAAAVAFTLLAMRSVAIEPLGVTRRGREPRRRLAWRLLLPVLGFALLAPLIGRSHRLGSTSGQIEASAGIVLVLVGLCALLPWFVEAIVTRVDGGPLAWLLAVRRLRADHGTSGRVVSAIGLAVAGAIALQATFSAANAQSGTDSSTNPMRNTLQVFGVLSDAANPVQSVTQQLAATHGVADAIAVASAGPGLGGQVSVAPCRVLTQIVVTTRCNLSSAYLIRIETSLKPGDRIGAGSSFSVPRSARYVAPRDLTGPKAFVSYVSTGALLLAPQAAVSAGLHPRIVDASVRLDPGVPAAADDVRTTVARIDPLASVSTDDVSTGNHTLQQLQHALLAGATAVLIVIGGSLLVAIAEQLRERRRVLAVLSAFGARRSTLAWSVVWQNVLPVAFGLALAVGLGIALGDVLMHIIGLRARFDWGAIALLTAAGGAVVAIVTGITLPMLWRQLRPTALRVE